MTARLAAAVAAFGLVLGGCGGGTDRPNITVVTQDRIAECGGGLRKYSGLYASVRAQLASGRITAGVERGLEAAFIAGLGRKREESVEIFKMYVGCITGSENLVRMIAESRVRIPRLRSQLAAKNVRPSALTEIEALHGDEITALEKRDFIAARDCRNRAIKRIIVAVQEAGTDFEGIDFTALHRSGVLAP